jgi:hypothetical protein
MLGTGYMEVAGSAAVNINNEIFIGNSAGSNGFLTLNGGSITASYLVVGKYGNGTFDMNGGTVNLSGALAFATLSGGAGVMSLGSGTVAAANLTFGEGAGMALDIEAGLINLAPDLSAEDDPAQAWTDYKSRIEGYSITGYGNAQNVVFNWDDQNYLGSISAVPEPGTIMLLSLGSTAILLRSKKAKS